MNLKDKMKKFNKRWDINDSENEQQAFEKFRTGVFNIFRDIDSHITKESVEEFCLFFGITEEWESDMYGSREWGKNVINKLYSASSEIEFFKILEVIFALDITTTRVHRHDIEYSKGILLNKVAQAIDYSGVNLSVSVTKDKEIIFYPKGEEMLDNKVVNNVLSFLDQKSNSHFIDALKFYNSKNWIKSAESLRRTVEEFLRVRLGNKSGLQQNRLEIGKKLKADATASQIREIVSQIFGYLDQYFNENSKHNDGDIDEAECEFLIYQVGLLMRYINKALN